MLSKFIRPGDQSLKTKAPAGLDVLAVRNDKSLVIFLQNDSKNVSIKQLKVADKLYDVELPATSLCAFVFKVKKY